MSESRCPKCGAERNKLCTYRKNESNRRNTYFFCGSVVSQEDLPVFVGAGCLQNQITQANDEIHGLNKSLDTMEGRLATCKERLQVAEGDVSKLTNELELFKDLEAMWARRFLGEETTSDVVVKEGE